MSFDTRPDSNPLIRKLATAESLKAQDRSVLAEMCSRPRYIEAGQDIIRAGDPPSDVHLVLDGFACRYKILPEGSRQIVAVLQDGAKRIVATDCWTMDVTDETGRPVYRVDVNVGVRRTSKRTVEPEQR